MKTTRRRGLLVSALIIVLALTTAGVASAMWAQSGAGSGAGTTGTTQALVLTPGTASTQLYPGGQSAVAVTLANPNQGPVRAPSLSLDTTQGTGGFAVDVGHSTCGVASLSFTTQTNGWTIPANGSSALSLASSLSMNTSAANACQGASFTVYLKVGP